MSVVTDSGARVFLDDPLAGWGNDDLLISDAARDHVRSRHPELFPILDWPDLRTRFLGFNVEAGLARKHSRRSGIAIAILGYVGLLLSAFQPFMGSQAATPETLRWLAALISAFAVVSVIWGYAQLLAGKRKASWLHNRLCTERLRQLYFQFLINNLELASAAVHDPVARAAFEAKRAAALQDFERQYVRFADTSLQQIYDDEAEEQFWLADDWNRPAPPRAASATDELLGVLAFQRFEIQRRFADKKIAPSLYSCTRNARLVRFGSDALTGLALLATLVSAGLLLTGTSLSGAPVLAIATFIAVCSATVVLLRVLNEGLQLTSESERYTWYKAAVSALARRYANARVRERVEILRDMERLSYQEMRWFLTSFKSARFVL